MKLIKLAAATLNQTPMDWDNNQANILAAIQQAKLEQVDILCLPELCISGYGCEDAFLGIGLLKQAQRVLLEIVPETKNIIATVGLPILHENRIYNAVCLLVNGEIKGFVPKRFLANDGIHYETRWFHAWQLGIIDQIKIGEQLYPMGDLYFDCGGIKIGFEICEEAWVAQRPGIRLAESGVDVILNPSASHFSFQKRETRLRLVLEGSRAFGCAYIYVNLLGNEAGRVIYDGDTLLTANGELLNGGKRFSFSNYQLVTTVVDIDKSRMTQARTSHFYSNREACIQVPFNFPQRFPMKTMNWKPEAWEISQYLKEEEFARAVALGLYDYLRKSRSQGFVLSLSGGADSGAIACLIYIMINLGAQELGMQAFCEKLPKKNLNQNDILTLMNQLLICVYQATKNSSNITFQAAKEIAQAVGANFINWSVDSLVENYVGIVENALKRQLSWEKDDLALQNIQARTRSPGVWLLANIFNGLLLATSNRSESAVGYATMDGDTSGGLSPLAGIDKDFIRHWLKWLEITGLHGLKPIPELQFINAQQPTAELRPGLEQTDEKDLMPYDLLNAIEKAAIRDRQTPLEILYLLESCFDYPKEQLIIWIERFFKLWVQNQWKRERFAPSFHLDDESLDPKTWCRFPILSGGFQHELAEMHQQIKS
jgi:NAD+ synthase (glutamine-hydrolysing)